MTGTWVRPIRRGGSGAQNVGGTTGMSLGKSRLYRETLVAATAFHARKLWEEYEPDECLAVTVPGRDRPMFASIMGQGGEEFGLMLTCGEHAYRDMLIQLTSDGYDEEANDAADVMGFSMVPLHTIPTQRRRFLETAKFRGRRESIVPHFLVKKPGRRPRDCVNRQEAETFLYVVKGVLVAHDRGILAPRAMTFGADVLTLTVTGDPLKPDVSAEFVCYEPTSAVEARPAVPMPAGLDRLPRLGQRWLVGFPVLPVAVDEDGHDDPRHPQPGRPGQRGRAAGEHAARVGTGRLLIALLQARSSRAKGRIFCHQGAPSLVRPVCPRIALRRDLATTGPTGPAGDGGGHQPDDGDGTRVVAGLSALRTHGRSAGVSQRVCHASLRLPLGPPDATGAQGSRHRPTVPIHGLEPVSPSSGGVGTLRNPMGGQRDVDPRGLPCDEPRLWGDPVAHVAGEPVGSPSSPKPYASSFATWTACSCSTRSRPDGDAD